MPTKRLGIIKKNDYRKAKFSFQITFPLSPTDVVLAKAPSYCLLRADELSHHMQEYLSDIMKENEFHSIFLIKFIIA